MTCILILGAGLGVWARSGDEADGSRSPYVHVLPLYPEDRAGQKGSKIAPRQQEPPPMSMRWSCGNCHDYDVIAKGWHFNSMDPNIMPGRPGQPWIYVEPRLGVQAPLSYRRWPGVLSPDLFGISTYEFVRRFGRHMPGWGSSEAGASDPNQPGLWRLSGRLEVNCLACHNANPGQDQGGPFGYADQVREGNFRWAATASSEVADVKGSVRDIQADYDPFSPGRQDPNHSAPRVSFKQGAFDDNNDVFFDLVKRVPKERCSYCHSNRLVGIPEAHGVAGDEDVHLALGLRCVDCHRNGIDHQVARGFEGQFSDPNHMWASGLSCQGCHLGSGNYDIPAAGRMAAPVPKHKGIPLVHFDKLACTACHSGPWPRGQAGLVKTSRAHALGSTYAEKADQALPHILFPVFAKQADGKIAPCKMIWPAYWATTQGSDARVMPVPLSVVDPIAKKAIRRSWVPKTNDWAPLTDDLVLAILAALAEQVQGRPVYVCGGQIHYRTADGKLAAEDHPAASPVLWPAAHDVRPARQALGVRMCQDCHDQASPFFFGKVPVDTPMVSGQGRSRSMSDFQGIDVRYVKVFGWSFVFRPWLKVTALVSCGILALLALAFAGKALIRVCEVLSGKSDG